MASFFSSVRQGLSRQSNRSPNSQLQERGHVPPPLPSPTLQQPRGSSASPVPPSPGLSSNMALPDHAAASGQQPPRRPPYFFREEYAGLIVKGNFMTLAAKPVHVDDGEWLAHQVVEQYRLLDSMIQIIRVVDEKTGLPICNEKSCPTMSASGRHTYTWLDNNKRPIKIPAYQYIQLVQKWIVGKISDPALFPTDTSNLSSISYPSGGLNTPGSNTPIPTGPTNLPLSSLTGKEWLGKISGFPENFEQDIRSIYRQMMRCYAHLYHGHWMNPFWDLNAYKELNTCFIHFVNVGKLFNLIGEKDMEPMQPLIELWIVGKLLPATQRHAQMQTAPPGQQGQLQSQQQQQQNLQQSQPQQHLQQQHQHQQQAQQMAQQQQQMQMQQQMPLQQQQVQQVHFQPQQQMAPSQAPQFAQPARPDQAPSSN